MRERDAQIALLIRAIEEADPEGTILPGYRRFGATRRALIITGLAGESGDRAVTWRIRTGEAVLRRARLLYDGIVRQEPRLRHVLALADLGVSTAPSTVLIAFVAGALSTLVVPLGVIPLFYPPLLAVFAWNLLVYALLAAWILTGSRTALHELPARLGNLFLRWALARRLRRIRAAGRATPVQRAAISALLRFGALWHRSAQTLVAARVRRLLHLAAIAFAAGVLVGVWLEYSLLGSRVVWRGLWFSDEVAQVAIETLLGPAAWLGRTTVPDVSLAGPDGDHPAAWLRLYTGMTFLLVVLPRAVLVVSESLRAARLAAALPVDLDDGYFRRLFGAWRGARKRVEVVPYAYRPQPASLDRLRLLLHDYFGSRARVRMHGALGRGDGAAWLVEDPLGPDEERCWVVLFDLADEPERDVQRAFLVELKTHLGPSEQLLAVVDTSSAGPRGEDLQTTWAPRLGAWLAMVGETGIHAVDLPLGRAMGDFEITDELVERIRKGLWPPESNPLEQAS